MPDHTAYSMKDPTEQLETGETPGSKIYSITEAASSVPVTIANKSPTCFLSSLDACAPTQLYEL